VTRYRWARANLVSASNLAARLNHPRFKFKPYCSRLLMRERYNHALEAGQSLGTGRVLATFSPVASRQPMPAEVIYPLGRRRVWVAGHRGMVVSALLRRLASEDCEELTATSAELDLRRQDQVEAWMARMRPDTIFMAAAKVGGIAANDAMPADFLYDNLMIETNAIAAAHRNGVRKLLFLGSSCIYPRLAPQPIPEAALLTGPLEPTNEWYAVAKIAGIKLTQAYRRQHGCDFISAMPANLYGPGDNFDLVTSHVLPALIRKAHAAKLSGAAEMIVWGSGAARREFMHVDDCADALVFLMQRHSGAEHVNIGHGEEITIADLARQVADTVGFTGGLRFDPARPDGTPRKLMDRGKLMAMGWTPRISPAVGVRSTYAAFLEEYAAS
jgi:GDP-L-fucose synthase